MVEARPRSNALLEEAAKTSADAIGATMRNLGFSGYAAQTFCALVRVAHATASDLVRRTGIPDSKIYYALDELTERGLVEVQPGKPKTYRAVPAKQIEARLQRMLDAKYDAERAGVARVVSVLEPLRAA